MPAAASEDQRMNPQEDVIDSPVDWVARHIRSYVESDGANASRYGGADVLLLTTRGRRSGKLRRTALIYGKHSESYVVVGSNGGSAAHPLWYLNLQADPTVYVQAGPQTFTARAHTAEGGERQELWAMMTKVFPSYAGFQRRTKREIPVVVLVPVA
jgi:deazaflavin-dependent oxidoreductase (nitroreductase family)